MYEYGIKETFIMHVRTRFQCAINEPFIIYVGTRTLSSIG